MCAEPHFSVLQKRLKVGLSVVDWQLKKFAQVLADMTKLADKEFFSNLYVSMLYL